MVAAKRQELAYPLRWYSIPNLWRYERPQRGRLREHWQLNVDVFGLSGLEAEHEVIMVADAIMQAFGARRDMYVIKVNSRKLIDAALKDYLQLSEVQTTTLIKLIDRMHKMDPAAFTAEADAILTPTQHDNGLSPKLFELLRAADLTALPAELAEHESVKELKRLLELLTASGVTNIEYDITVMRGFDYYTDIVFEVFDVLPDNNRSLFGGGRYDGLVGLFGVEPVPTIGFGMGDVTLQNFLEGHSLLPEMPSETELYIVLIGDVYDQAQPVIHDLREMGVKVAVDSTNRKVDKQLKTAIKKNIPYALFIGEKELAAEQYVLKNLHTETEETHSVQRIVTAIKDFRHA
jgi:histidyl-tRNA synthetase